MVNLTNLIFQCVKSIEYKVQIVSGDLARKFGEYLLDFSIKLFFLLCFIFSYKYFLRRNLRTSELSSHTSHKFHINPNTKKKAINYNLKFSPAD